MIDEEGFLKNVDPFDREDAIFDDYAAPPQIQMKLNLVCATSQKLAVNQSMELFRSALVTDEIIFSRTITHLHIIVVDVNDNSPVFVYPTEGFSIGQSEESLLEKLMPQYLIRVIATDADEGENAKIKFSLSSEHFTIDSQTGIIYPLKNAMNDVDNVELVVGATDLDGAAGGKVTTTRIFVKKIRRENVVVLKFTKNSAESLQDTIRALSVGARIDLRMINHVETPIGAEARSRQLVVESTEVIMFAYAFDDESSLLLSSEEILRRITWDQLINAEAYSSYSDCSLTGWIVAVSVLGSLLLLAAISIPFIWMFWLRHRFASRRNSEVSIKKLEEDFNVGETGRTSPMVIENENEYEAPMSDAEIIGIEIDGATQGNKSQLAVSTVKLFLTFRKLIRRSFGTRKAQ